MKMTDENKLKIVTLSHNIKAVCHILGIAIIVWVENS
jgi:hypothetical protein